MDLGIKGRSAIVCGASAGLGYACAHSLAEAGVNVLLVARGAERLDAAAKVLRQQFPVEVTTLAANVTTAEGRAAILQANPTPDILVNNAGGPPPGDFRNWERDDWIAALDANMLAPIEMIRATVDHMAARKFGRIINITSSAVKAPIDILGLSNGARSGLTGFVAGVARTTVINNVTINNLLPGPFDTDRLRSTFEVSSTMSNRPVADVEQEWKARNPAGRFGRPEEFGAMCAFLCSQYAGFMTGQNILMDGGAYPGTF
ncbi:SDR family oxidoreductase [Alcaligenaceae bacterium]|nr:SDR family oxidoreductase [Alcaligenaceae bacterium]